MAGDIQIHWKSLILPLQAALESTITLSDNVWNDLSSGNFGDIGLWWEILCETGLSGCVVAHSDAFPREVDPSPSSVGEACMSQLQSSANWKSPPHPRHSYGATWKSWEKQPKPLEFPLRIWASIIFVKNTARTESCCIFWRDSSLIEGWTLILW